MDVSVDTTSPSTPRYAGRRQRVALSCLLIVAALAFTLSNTALHTSPAQATIGVDDYPNYAANTVDPWRFYARTCTSFVAWRLYHDNGISGFTNGMGGGWFGNATTWADNARALGYRVDSQPAVGSIAHWTGADMPSSGGFGHVAWVKQVNADGSVVVEEYNYNTRYTYDQRVTRAPRYIHLRDLGPSGPPTTPPPTPPPTTAPPPPPPPPPQAPVPVPFSSWMRFVERQFLDEVGRLPTADEANSWGQLLTSGQLNPDSFVNTLIDNGPLPQQLAPVVRLYQAYFRRPPDDGGLRYWYDQFRNGMPFNAISLFFSQSPEFQAMYGNLDNAHFVALLYNNTMSRQGDPQGLAFWAGELDSGRRSRGDVMIGFSESPEFIFRSATAVKVIEIYAALVQRAPDPSGWLYWTNVFNTQWTGAQQLIAALRGSGEYASRAAA